MTVTSGKSYSRDFRNKNASFALKRNLAGNLVKRETGMWFVLIGRRERGGRVRY